MSATLGKRKADEVTKEDPGAEDAAQEEAPAGDEVVKGVPTEGGPHLHTEGLSISQPFLCQMASLSSLETKRSCVSRPSRYLPHATLQPLSFERLLTSRCRRMLGLHIQGKTLVDIREFYEADGDMKPGKKGISLNVENWGALVKAISGIQVELDKLEK